MRTYCIAKSLTTDLRRRGRGNEVGRVVEKPLLHIQTVQRGERYIFKENRGFCTYVVAFVCPPCAH